MDYDIDGVRNEFPSLQSGTAFFDGPGGSQVPRSVGEAIASTLTSAISNRGSVTASARRAEEVVVGFRAAAADLLGAQPGGIVYGRSATALTFDFARTLSREWKEGDEVVVSRLDHDANVSPWVLAAERVGAVVKWCDLDPTSGDLTTDHLAAQLTERTTLVAFTAASNLIGSRPDVRALTDLAHTVGATVWLDAVHAVPHVRTNLAELGVDALVCSPYKFLGSHCAIVAADPAWLAERSPDKLTPSSNDVPERFELGTLPYELLAGVTAAVDFLADLAPGDGDRPSRLDASFAALEHYEDALFGELLAGLSAQDHVRLIADPARRTPTVLFQVYGMTPAAVADRLAGLGVNAPAGTFYANETARHLGLDEAGAVRAGLAPYSSADDVRRLLDGIAACA